MVLAERDDVDADLVGQHRLVDDLPDRRAVGDDLALIVAGQVAEGVDAELEAVCRSWVRSLGDPGLTVIGIDVSIL